jgi:nucleotide-binding universal stress UspA family protein
MNYKKILLSLEVLEDENNVIKEAVSLTSLFNAELTAVHINDPSAGKPSMMMDSLPLKTENDIREQFRKLGYEKEAKEIKVNIIESQHYAKEIADAAKKADLLIIGHHPKNRFLASIIDSVDERVADIVPCPMLVVPRAK